LPHANETAVVFDGTATSAAAGSALLDITRQVDYLPSRIRTSRQFPELPASDSCRPSSSWQRTARSMAEGRGLPRACLPPAVALWIYQHVPGVAAAERFTAWCRHRMLFSGSLGCSGRHFRAPEHRGCAGFSCVLGLSYSSRRITRDADRCLIGKNGSPGRPIHARWKRRLSNSAWGERFPAMADVLVAGRRRGVALAMRRWSRVGPARDCWHPRLRACSPLGDLSVARHGVRVSSV